MRVTPAAVLYEDERWLVLDKPAGLLTTPNGPNDRSLVDRARALAPRAPGLHPLSRLAAPGTGAVLFARDESALRVAAEARAAGRLHRWYAGLATGLVERTRGVWTWSIAVDLRRPTQRVCAEGTSSKPAETRWTVVARGAAATALSLAPVTGRTHQLRVHAARAGHPLLGDVAYGGGKRVTSSDGAVLAVPRVMLHARAVWLPDLGTVVEAPLPDDLRTVLAALVPEADEAAFSRARTTVDELPEP